MKLEIPIFIIVGPYSVNEYERMNNPAKSELNVCSNNDVDISLAKCLKTYGIFSLGEIIIIR